MAKKVKKHRESRSFVGFIENEFRIRLNTRPINGKLMDCLVPSKEAADTVMRYNANYTEWKKRYDMLAQRIQETEGEERSAYQDQFKSLINEYKPSPSINTHPIRMRVVRTIQDEAIMEPAFDRDKRILKNLGYYQD